MKPSEAMHRHARALIAGRMGLYLGDVRATDLERGLVDALRHGPASTSEEQALAWLAALPDDSPAWRRLAGHLTVGETYFFRDGQCFEALEREVLPALIAARRAEGTRRLRLWSAGCATGEEPYSLAILLDRLLPDATEWALTLLATDINPDALEAALRGRYREHALRETPPGIRGRYFRRRGGAAAFELDARIRRMVAFAPLNLAVDGYPALVTNTSAMDLIVCRNVLMYFGPEAQRASIARLGDALVPGGWLVVSPAEASANLFRPLVPVNFPGAIFFRKEQSAVSGQPSAIGGAPTSRQAERPIPAARQPGAVATPPDEGVEAPPDAGALRERARRLADRGDLDDARRLCEAALARERLDPDAHLLLAAICQEQGDGPSARQALRRAIYLAPDSAPAHFMLGSLLLRQREPKRGRRCMETVVSLLAPMPPGAVVPGGDGLTAGRLLEAARAYLEPRG